MAVQLKIERKLRKEDWELIERKIENFSGVRRRRRLFVRGMEVMLIVWVRLEFNYLFLTGFFNFWLFVGPVQFVSVSGSKSKRNQTY